MTQMVRLTESDLQSYRNQGIGQRAGKYQRYFCPVHGSDNQRSLQVNPDNGHFKCFSCGVWGYLDEYRAQRLEKDHQSARYTKPERITDIRISSQTPSLPSENTSAAGVLKQMQMDLVESLGAKYLEHRGIPVELAQAYLIGYAKPGTWPHKNRDWKWGRLVFPHETPTGDVVNLYGRAVGENDKVPKGLRHDHLPGPKGIFNAPALNANTVFICEGVFDALSLMAAGYYDSCAIYGVNGLRWGWVKAERIVFCLDRDATGQRQWRQLAYEAMMLGHEVFYLPDSTYRAHKDLNEVWIATGSIDIGEWHYADLPPMPDMKEPWDAKQADYMLISASDRISAVFVADAFDWATTNNPALIKAYDDAEVALNETYKSRDMDAFIDALVVWEECQKRIMTVATATHQP